MVSRTSCFRRHNFAGILLDTLQDLAQRPEGARTSVMMAMEQGLEGILQRNSGVKIRPQLEQTTEMFGRSLYLVGQLSSEHHALGDRFIMKFCQICQTILYEDRPTKKVSLPGASVDDRPPKHSHRIVSLRRWSFCQIRQRVQMHTRQLRNASKKPSSRQTIWSTISMPLKHPMPKPRIQALHTSSTVCPHRKCNAILSTVFYSLFRG